MRFRDYAQWLARQEREPEMRATESYWQEQFRGPVPILELPADRPRPLVKTYRGARLARTIHPFLFKALQRLAARHGCTLLTTLLTGFALLLHRLTRQDDIVVGLPTAGQALVDARSLVGHCVNFLALRTRIAGDPTVAEALVSMKRTVLDAYDHQNYTLGALLRTLNLGRDASRVPLVNATLNLDRDLEPPRFHGLEAVVSKNPTGFVKFDLDCNFIETRSALELECEYNTDLFDARTVERWLGHFETLLSGMAADSARRISELPLLTPGERQEMATAWNDTRTDYPTDVCLHELFEAQVERTPGAVAAVFGSERVTYRELSTRANELAHRLRTLGVGPEVLVAICVTRSVEALVGLLGILKAGGAYVPLDPSYPKDRLAFMMEESRASVLLTERRYAKSFPSRGFQTLCLDEGRKTLRSARAQAPLARATPRNLAYVFFTSGSTGWPKGVAIEHRSVVALLDWAKRVFAPGDLAGVLASTSLSFDLSVFELFVPWSAGGKVILVKDILQLPQLSSRAEVTLVNTVPSAIAELLRADSLPASVRTVNLAGEPLQNSLVQRIYSQVSVGEVYNLYGPTESTTYSTFARARREAAETPSIGHPIANSEVYLLDARLEPVPVGVPGELYIGGAGLARGYQNRPELTAENFLANPFCVEAGSRMYRTGDLARYLVNGEIEFLGRVDNQVKVRGFRIELGEIETVLAQYPSVRESAVVAREDIAGEKRLVAYVVFGRGPAPTTEALRSFLREKLPGHMIPSAFSVLGALPRTPNGKIDRAALPAAGQTRPESEKRYLAPRDSLERQLVEIWERVLRIRPIGIDDNFFELGGHSLLVVRLFGRVEKIARRKLPLATIFQAPTVRDLAAVLHQEGWTPSWSSLVPIQPAGGRPPFYCVHAAGGNVLTYRDLARHLGPDQPVYGLQAQGLGGNLPPQTRVEDMAAHYIREIRNLQAEGPYFLGGSSFGGMVAFEMARQLQAAGQEVGVLALFDTYGPDYPKPLPGTSRLWLRMYAIVERFDLHIGNLLVARPREKMDYLKEKSKRLRKRIRTRFRKLKRYPLPRALREVENATRQAIINYVPKIYSGRITLFRASKQPAGFFPDPELGWGAVAAGGVDVHEVPGYHGAIVYEPRIRVLAEQLRICLEKANAAKEETTEGRLSAAIQ